MVSIIFNILLYMDLKIITILCRKLPAYEHIKCSGSTNWSCLLFKMNYCKICQINVFLRTLFQADWLVLVIVLYEEEKKYDK